MYILGPLAPPPLAGKYWPMSDGGIFKIKIGKRKKWQNVKDKGGKQKIKRILKFQDKEMQKGKKISRKGCVRNEIWEG
jgi:hypothetical protein